MLWVVLRPSSTQALPDEIVEGPFCSEEALTSFRAAHDVVTAVSNRHAAVLIAKTVLRIKEIEGTLVECSTCGTKCYPSAVIPCSWCGRSICPSKECELAHGHQSRVFLA